MDADGYNTMLIRWCSDFVQLGYGNGAQRSISLQRAFSLPLQVATWTQSNLFLFGVENPKVHSCSFKAPVVIPCTMLHDRDQ